jgi:hypothetical protein
MRPMPPLPKLLIYRLAERETATPVVGHVRRCLLTLQVTTILEAFLDPLVFLCSPPAGTIRLRC